MNTDTSGRESGVKATLAEFKLITINRGRRKTIPKRSVVVNGRKSSVSLEDEFWAEIVAIAAAREIPLGELISELDRQRRTANLSSAIRTFVLRQYYSFNEPA